MNENGGGPILPNQLEMINSHDLGITVVLFLQEIADRNGRSIVDEVRQLLSELEEEFSET